MHQEVDCRFTLAYLSARPKVQRIRHSCLQLKVAAELHHRQSSAQEFRTSIPNKLICCCNSSRVRWWHNRYDKGKKFHDSSAWETLRCQQTLKKSAGNISLPPTTSFCQSWTRSGITSTFSSNVATFSSGQSC